MSLLFTPECTQAPEIVSLYAIPVTPAYVRHCIRQKFEANRHVTDPRAIEVLVHKGRQDLQETLNCWKQTDHVMGILLKADERPQRTFLQKFIEGVLLSSHTTVLCGRDTNAV